MDDLVDYRQPKIPKQGGPHDRSKAVLIYRAIPYEAPLEYLIVHQIIIQRTGIIVSAAQVKAFVRQGAKDKVASPIVTFFIAYVAVTQRHFSAVPYIGPEKCAQGIPAVDKANDLSFVPTLTCLGEMPQYA